MINISIPEIINISNITKINTLNNWKYCINPDYNYWLLLTVIFLIIPYFEFDYWLKDKLKIDETHPGYIRYIFKHDFWIGMALNINLFFLLFNLIYV